MCMYVQEKPHSWCSHTAQWLVVRLRGLRASTDQSTTGSILAVRSGEKGSITANCCCSNTRCAAFQCWHNHCQCQTSIEPAGWAPRKVGGSIVWVP
jgi:hypothetical protein